MVLYQYNLHRNFPKEGMMNLKERQFNLIFPILILLPFCLLGLFVFWKIRPYSVKEIYEKTWLITLPDTISLSEDHTQNSFDGENYRYTVFENKENQIIDLSFTRNAGETDDICRDVLKFYEKEISDFPDFDNCLYVFTRERNNKILVILYDSNSKKIYCFVKPE